MERANGRTHGHIPAEKFLLYDAVAAARSSFELKLPRRPGSIGSPLGDLEAVTGTRN